MRIIKRPEPPPHPEPAAKPAVAAQPVQQATPAPAPAEPKKSVSQMAQNVTEQIRQAKAAAEAARAQEVQEAQAQQAQQAQAQRQAQQRPVGGTEDEQPYDDGIRQRNPYTGELMTNELDQADFEYIGQGDPLRALYQGLLWAAESFRNLAKNTPAIATLSPGSEYWLDQIAYWGYTFTNGGAELCRGLWNWPFTRVVLNQQLEMFIRPEERRQFDRLYQDYFDNIIVPVESGQREYNPEFVKGWIGQHTDEIADPRGFLKLCSERYTMEKIAAKHMMTPTEMLSRTMPIGERKKTTTGLESVFRRKPG